MIIFKKETWLYTAEVEKIYKKKVQIIDDSLDNTSRACRFFFWTKQTMGINVQEMGFKSFNNV